MFDRRALQLGIALRLNFPSAAKTKDIADALTNAAYTPAEIAEAMPLLFPK